MTEREHCEAVAEKIIRAGWGQGYRVIHPALADLIERERADAAERALKKAEHLVEQHRIETGWTTAIKLLDDIRALRSSR